MKLSSLQIAVTLWMDKCFGSVIAEDKVERNFRFLEESLELVQAGGCSKEDAHALVEYVYGRPVGELSQEVGGVSITLAALCQAHGVSWEAAAVDEYKRIDTQETMEKIRTKQASKPNKGPLPGAYTVEVNESGRLVGSFKPGVVYHSTPSPKAGNWVQRLFERDCPSFVIPEQQEVRGKELPKILQKWGLTGMVLTDPEDFEALQVLFEWERKNGR